MQRSTESLIYKAIVAAAYSVNTLAELMSYYFDLNVEDNPEQVKELRILIENVQASMQLFVRRWEEYSNRGHTASRSIIVGTFKTTKKVALLVDSLRNPD